MVRREDDRDDQERLPKSKIGNYQKRGSELEKPELKFS
jgi:hypothetical protein